MILQRLVEYAARLEREQELPPPMYDETPVRWSIELDTEGTPEGFIPLGGNNERNRRGEALTVPYIVRARKIKPKLLADNGEYVLGVPRAGTDSDKVVERHRQFVELAEYCAEETGEESVRSVVEFLRAWDGGKYRELLAEDFDPQDNVTFRVRGVRPAVDLESVQAFWARNTLDEDNPVMTCLVTGEVGPVEQRLPVKVKGLTGIGGQAAGTSIVSANASAFESYGLENSLTSPISRDAGERFGKALNQLLQSKNSRIYIGSLVYVFWTREESEFGLDMLREPDPGRVKNLFDSARTGIEQREKGNDFYALALSASGGRAVVRDWLETTVSDAAESLRRWFRAQRIVNARGENADPLGLYPLAASGYRDATKEMTPQIPAALIRAAVKGGLLPEELLAQAVRRNRAEGDVTWPRAALMKLVLSYGRGDAELTETAERLENLDRESKDRGYNCGRLLAELEELQRAAIPGVKATIVDRYYGAASSAPGSVFGTLMRNSNAHLGKVRKERPGVGVAIQDRIGEIATSIGRDFPNTLTLREQATFALGYYHQRAQNRADAKAAREARESREES